MKILYITSFIPKKNASQAGINVSFDLIKTIKENFDCEIDITGVINSHQINENEGKDISKYVNEMKFVEINKVRKVKNIIYNFSKPLIAAVRYDERIKNIIKELFDKYNYDYVICDYTQNSAYGSFINKISPSTKTILIEHDVCFQGFERKEKLNKLKIRKLFLRFESNRLKKYEVECIKRFNSVVTLNMKDFDIIKDYGDVHIINPYINIMDIKPTIHKEFNIMFWGAMNRNENEDAVNYFIDEIWPYVEKENVKFYIVGANPSEEIKNLECDNIVVTGFVEDPKLIFENMDISIIPLRLGAGIKIKVLESMAAGLPVITTDVGAEGIVAENKKDLIIENNSKEFANNINMLKENKEMKKILSINGKKCIRGKYFDGHNINVLHKILNRK